MEEILKRIFLENQEFIKTLKYIERNITIPKTEQIKILTGSRRSGKTYLLYSQCKKIAIDPVLFLDFEDERILEINSLKNYDIILDSYHRLFPNNRPVLFFDEIQSLRNWHLYVKRMYAKGFQIYITGSNSNLLSREISTYLSGRGIEINIFPFSFSEFLKLKENRIDFRDFVLKKVKILNLFDEYLFWGGFPEVIRSEDKQNSAKTIFNLLFYKDIISRFSHSEFALKLIINKLIENVGKSFSLSKLHHKIQVIQKISKPTVIECVNSLHLPFLVETVLPYRKSFVNRERERKIYFLDNSFIMLGSISIDKGKLLENLVFIELKRREQKIHYYKTFKGLEIDFVTIDQALNVIEMIQVSFDLADFDTKERELKSLIAGNNELNCDSAKILTYNQEEIIEKDGLEIEVIPVWKWLLNHKSE